MLPSTTGPPLAPNFLEICCRIFLSIASCEAPATMRSTCPHTAPMKAMPIMRVSSSGVGACRLATSKPSRTKNWIFLSRMVLRAEAGSSRHDVERGELRLEDERAAFHQPAQRIGVAEHLVVGRNDDFDVFQLGVGEQHRFGAESDVVIGRRAALFRTVFRRRLRVQIEHAGEDVGEQLAGGDGAVAAHRMEADAERRLGQAGSGSARSPAPSARFRDRPPSAFPATQRRAARGPWRRIASRDRRTERCAPPCS